MWDSLVISLCGHTQALYFGSVVLRFSNQSELSKFSASLIDRHCMQLQGGEGGGGSEGGREGGGGSREEGGDG